jgi:hypothetical protein
MRKRRALFVTAVLGVAMAGGCYTTTIDKGPPKIGQTVERPNPGAKATAEDHANQVQQDTSADSTVVPGNNPEPVPAMGNSIFTNGAVSNPNTAGANMGTGNSNANTSATVPQTQNPPEGSPLTPTNSSAPIKDGG